LGKRSFLFFLQRRRKILAFFAFSPLFFFLKNGDIFFQISCGGEKILLLQRGVVGVLPFTFQIAIDNLTPRGKEEIRGKSGVNFYLIRRQILLHPPAEGRHRVGGNFYILRGRKLGVEVSTPFPGCHPKGGSFRLQPDLEKVEFAGGGRKAIPVRGGVKKLFPVKTGETLRGIGKITF
jgi:hypothetical protein